MSRFLSKNCENPNEEARRRREVRRYFDKADVNKDGKLSKEEWYSVLNGSGVPTSKQEVEEFFNYMDRDYDGRLSFEEFMGEECTIEKLFKNMDKNGDGFVSKQVEVAFSQFDSSGDERLNYREFCEMCNKKNI